VLAPVSSTVSSAFPNGKMSRLPADIPLETTSCGGDFRGCRHFVMFRPPSLLAPQVVPTAAITAAGQPGLLRPGTSCFVASARTGYANRLKTGNWRYGDSHPARLRPCRLLLSIAPLRFRKAGFPRYGSKDGLSERTFPDRSSVKPAPGMPVGRSGLSPSFVLAAAAWVLRSKSETTCSVKAPPCERLTSLYSRGPRSGSGYAVPSHRHLIDPIRPTRGHSTTSSHCDLYVLPSLCGSA
jgi:hypothetical protein